MSVVLGRNFVGLAISWMSKFAAARLGAHAPPAAEAQTPSFADITSASHVDFKHKSGHTSRKYLIETMGAGVAILD